MAGEATWDAAALWCDLSLFVTVRDQTLARTPGTLDCEHVIAFETYL